MEVWAVKGKKQSGASASDFEQFILSTIDGDLTQSTRKWFQSRSRDFPQAITKALNGEGKPTAGFMYNDCPLLHASAGKSGRTGNITLFFIIGAANGTFRLLGIGEHVTSTEYNLAWIDNAAPFPGKKVRL